MSERYQTVRQKRTGKTHLCEQVEEVTWTLCGRRARRDSYRPGPASMVEADCSTCWTVLASRTPPARKRAAA